MSPRTGRPTENPKTCRLEIRLSEHERKVLEDLCGDLSANRTEIFILGMNLLADLSERGELKELVNALIIRNDILRCLSKEKNPQISEEENRDLREKLENSKVGNHNQIAVEIMNLFGK